MTKKLKVFLLIILTAICAACLFAGCKVGPKTKDEYLEGMDVNVTYYSGDGTFDTSNVVNVRETYFRSLEDFGGVPFFNVTTETSSSGISIKRAGYDFVGWYKVATYESGEHAGQIKYTYTAEGSSEAVPVYPVMRDNGKPMEDAETARPVFAREGVDEQIPERDVRPVPSGEALTSDYIVKSGEHLTVVAVWAKSLRIHYVLVCEEGKTYLDGEGNEYSNGSVLSESIFGNGDTASVNSSRLPLALGKATFVRTYADKECTTLASSVARPAEGITSVDVYSRYIDGDWKVVSTPDEVRSMFTALNSDYYILNDIPCANLSAVPLGTELKKFGGKICGNGHTISGLKFSVTNMARGRTYSIFGTVQATASIENLTLEDVTVTAEVRRSEVSLYAMFSSCESGATFENFKVEGITGDIKISSTGKLDNIPLVDGQYNTERWLFGGAENDQTFLNEHAGLTLTNGNITVS